MPSIGKSLLEGAASLFGSGARQGVPAKPSKPPSTGIELMAEKADPKKAKAVADVFK